jgi:hypothetical protein
MPVWGLNPCILHGDTFTIPNQHKFVMPTQSEGQTEMKKTWETPKLLVLVRTAPEDGVLQAEICKFFALLGPGDPASGPLLDCAIPAPGVPTCLEQQPS